MERENFGSSWEEEDKAKLEKLKKTTSKIRVLEEKLLEKITE